MFWMTVTGEVVVFDLVVDGDGLGSIVGCMNW